MPFGLTNAPASCQALVNNILRPWLDRTVVAYLDDILVYTAAMDLETHVREVRQVLQALQEYNMQANPQKCEFHKKEVEFLGFIISTRGIRIDPTKIESIIN